MKHLVLVDGNSVMFKVYYATAYLKDNLMKNDEGHYTNALLGFINILKKILQKTQGYLLIAFDSYHITKKREIYPDYKKGRSPTPAALISQITLIKQYLDFSGIKYHEQAGYEADDIIGTLAKKASINNVTVEIFSSDKDFLQLVDNNIKVCLMKKGLSKVEVYNLESLFDKYGLKEYQMIDFKSLVGDPSDNIKGVLGVGPKTAIKLLQKFDNLENIFSSLDKININLQNKLKSNQDKVFFNRSLMTINIFVPLPFDLLDTKIKDYDVSSLMLFLKKMNFKQLILKMQKNI